MEIWLLCILAIPTVILFWKITARIMTQPDEEFNECLKKEKLEKFEELTIKKSARKERKK